MGGGHWTHEDWTRHCSRSVTGKPIHEIFGGRDLDPLLDPKGIKFRESCDSPDNPSSTGIIVALDVTGSMGPVLEAMARKGLNTLATEIYRRKPVTDPHLMLMGVGDVEMGDRAPLQVTQFEADIRIAEQLQRIWLEGGGGGNSHESYLLPWYFAARHTRMDCLLKRGRKGYLFTIGDEEPQFDLKAADVERVLGYRPQQDLDARELFTLVSRSFEVFHVIVEEGSHYCASPAPVSSKWAALLGQRALHLADHTLLAEVVVSAIQVVEGARLGAVADSWDSRTRGVVRRALQGLATPGLEPAVVRF